MLATEAEADREWIENVGRENPQRAWISSPRDVWYKNPFYSVPAGEKYPPHPEDDSEEEFVFTAKRLPPYYFDGEQVGYAILLNGKKIGVITRETWGTQAHFNTYTGSIPVPGGQYIRFGASGKDAVRKALAKAKPLILEHIVEIWNSVAYVPEWTPEQEQ